MVEAVVEFDYNAQESDELTIRKGDRITDVKIQSGGWWEGSLAGKRGMFPDNFVKVVTKPDGSGKTSVQNDYVTLRPKSGRCCKVLFSYQPVNDDELQLQVDDIIDIICEVEDGWWKGRLRDMVGMFPSNFVTEIVVEDQQKPRPSSRDEASESDGERSTSVSSPDSSQLLDSIGKPDPEADLPLLPPKPVKEQCRVLFPYEAANSDELTLKEGDTITLLSREVQDKGWWRGELLGQVGLFPDNFVELVTGEEPPKKPERVASKSQTATTNRARDTITKPPAKSDVPPVPGKKPHLQVKKTERLSTGSLPNDVVDGAGPSRVARSMDALTSEVAEFDSVERSAMLTHPTATRAKAPGRRPPSSSFIKDVDAPGLTNGTASSESLHEETGKRPWEKTKAPWMEELKLNQARKGGTHIETPRGVTARNIRPQSMYSDLSNPPKPTVAPPTKLLRLVPMSKANTNAEVTPSNTEVAAKEPTSKSVNNHSKDSVSVPLAKSNSFKTDINSFSLTSQIKQDMSPGKISLSNSKGETKIDNSLDMETLSSRLHQMEQQQELFKQAIKELTQKLNEETQKRVQLEQQVNKLAELVTQV